MSFNKFLVTWENTQAKTLSENTDYKSLYTI